MKKLLFIIFTILSPLAYSSTIDCQGLYIGRIWVEQGVGLKAVVYLNNPTTTSGSYWSYFTEWSPEEKKEALSILMMAKASQHRVNVVTTKDNNCGLQDGSTNTKALYLATNP
ncbi:hypothetical protein [Pseudoalteromonas ostreae]|uniref:hypothetical protein n=1 Tax=Pseudoalteromonas ostreae TaxID=2774154 RepID=UPI001B382E31|nr:hypothetical protein [Pseudoalteromonas ostreae]